MTDTVTSFDGTKLAARRWGEKDGTGVLLANAIGANDAVWEPLIAKLPARWNLVTWDYRGLHGSEAGRSGREGPAVHAEDALAVAGHFDLERFTILTWSTGGRIALELAAEVPSRVGGLVMVCAGYGHPVGRLFRRLEISSALPLLASVAKHFPGHIEAPFRRMMGRPEAAGLVRQSGMVGPTADIELLVRHLSGMAACDARHLLATYEAVVGDSGEELLSTIESPVSLIAGGADRWTPLAMVRQMSRRMPRAELKVYDGATHYLPIEFPDELRADLVAGVGATT
ncbi:MAG TPA: alpha/beta hydrolase [Actinomycetota bacterium]|nr:alpha/beta hydrolase [Actinomycetota bacterium]